MDAVPGTQFKRTNVSLIESQSAASKWPIIMIKNSICVYRNNKSQVINYINGVDPRLPVGAKTMVEQPSSNPMNVGDVEMMGTEERKKAMESQI